jgi:hypothetical protein
MMRDPSAEYEHSFRKNTDKMYKYKPFDDLECKVIGKNKSGNGGFQCVLPNGVEFGMSSIGDLNGDGGKVGTIINITCQGFLDTGKPQYPKAIAIREDRTWEDYVSAWNARGS